MIKGNNSGVPMANSTDMCLVGDTRNPLHYKPLPKNEFPYKAHQNPPGNGRDPNMIRYDEGKGTGENGEI